LDGRPFSVLEIEKHEIPILTFENRNHALGVFYFAVLPADGREGILFDLLKDRRVMAISAFSSLFHHPMRKRRGEGDQGFVLKNERVEVGESYLSVMVDEEEQIAQGDRDTLAFLDLGVEMAVVARGNVPDVAGIAIDFAAVDAVGRNLGRRFMAFFAADVQCPRLLYGIIGGAVAVDFARAVAVQAFHALFEMNVGFSVLFIVFSEVQAFYSVTALADILGARRLERIGLFSVDVFLVAGIAAADMAFGTVQLGNGNSRDSLQAALLFRVPVFQSAVRVMQAFGVKIFFRGLRLLLSRGQKINADGEAGNHRAEDENGFLHRLSLLVRIADTGLIPALNSLARFLLEINKF